MQPETINFEIVCSTDDGKNTGCGPASPEHFNYGDNKQRTDGSELATQTDDLEHDTEKDTAGIP